MTKAGAGDGRGFVGQVAVVTGGSRGIGLAYSKAFAERGATVAVVDIRGNAAREAAASLVAQGHAARGYSCDVGDEESVAALFAAVDSDYGRVDALVNNAAIMLDVERPFKPFWETSWEEWQRVLDVNCGGIFLCCKHVRPIMERQRSGRIVNVTSDGIYRGYDLQLAYFASKGAVSIMTRCLAREFGQFDVAVNAVAPGLTLSESVLQSEFLQNVARPALMEAAALKRDQGPEDMAGTVLFLCSPESSCITGQTIVVNRGVVMI